MRKRNRMLIAVACAAVMSAGMAVTAQAAGWAQNNGQWYYYNDSGSRTMETGIFWTMTAPWR